MEANVTDGASAHTRHCKEPGQIRPKSARIWATWPHLVEIGGRRPESGRTHLNSAKFSRAGQVAA